ncbi:MAG: SulP family inorganic anion transporter [Nitrospirales bacterium]|nr:SulP family inorganic anion transporter [Nitrospirales bacterium]
MTRTQHDSNRELVGQGIGNMVSGFFGGIPGAGATMRSVANIRTGCASSRECAWPSFFLERCWALALG